MTEPMTVVEPVEPAHPGDATGGAFGKKAIGWIAFELARNPYYNLIVIYIFAPYFASTVVVGSDAGFLATTHIVTVAGIITALTAPFLGILADKGGRRKPLIGLFLGTLIICSASLWWSLPNGAGLGVFPTMAILTVAYCCYGFSEVLHNAMLPDAGRSSSLPIISGLGYATANIASVGMLFFFLFMLLLPNVPEMASFPFVAEQTALGLDPEMHEPSRFSGPFIAVWMTIFIIPFFVLMPDRQGRGHTWKGAFADLLYGDNFRQEGKQSLSERVASLVRYLKGLFREHPRAMRFLIARVIYADGMSALLTLGGVYAATFFGWNAAEIILFGIAGVLFGAVGGVIGGRLDQIFGPRRALLIELAFLITLLFIQLSMTPDALFFGLVPADHQVWSLGLFPSLADVAYFLMVIPVAIAIVASITSSRYMLVSTAPKDRIGEFFGLYAIAGTVTVWMAPLLVGTLQVLSGSQRVGMGSIGFMFLAGFLILLTMKRRPQQN